jgi:hypothetical protein
MLNAKELSRAIRMKKKNLLRPDWDLAGQNLEPTTVDELEQNIRISDALEDAGVEGRDHEPPSDTEMGEHESTQNIRDLKKISARIAKYFESL